MRRSLSRAIARSSLREPMYRCTSLKVNADCSSDVPVYSDGRKRKKKAMHAICESDYLSV